MVAITVEKLREAYKQNPLPHALLEVAAIRALGEFFNDVVRIREEGERNPFDSGSTA